MPAHLTECDGVDFQRVCVWLSHGSPLCSVKEADGSPGCCLLVKHGKRVIGKADHLPVEQLCPQACGWVQVAAMFETFSAGSHFHMFSSLSPGLSVGLDIQGDGCTWYMSGKGSLKRMHPMQSLYLQPLDGNPFCRLASCTIQGRQAGGRAGTRIVFGVMSVYSLRQAPKTNP